MRKAIGIDLGGTNLRVCLIDEGGRLLAVEAGAVPPEADGDRLVELISERAASIKGAGACEGLGLALAGAFDAKGRLMAGMTNLPALVGRPLADEIGTRLGLPVRLDNDARSAMRGEALFGAASGVRNALMITLGTGIGGGLMLDGKVRDGPHGLAGEIGLSLMPSDGRSGWVALEDVASPGGLRRTRGLGPEKMGEAIAAGDPAAVSELRRISERIAVAIINAHVLLDLERVILAGGLTRMGGILLDAVRGEFELNCPPAFRSKLSIEMTRLDPWGGAMGAAALLLAPRKPKRRAP